MLSLAAQRRLTLGLMLGVVAVAAAGLVWFAMQSPRSRFLPPDGAAKWIHYPVSPQVAAFAFRYEQHAEFRRTFELAEVPAWARLRVRAFQGCAIELNGRPVDLPEVERWSQVRACDVADRLRAGVNDLRVVAVNDVGPPVLWLSLEGPGWSVASDDQWRASLDGAAECPAHLARLPLPVRPGSAAAGGDRPLESLLARLPTLLLFAALSAGVLLLVGATAGRLATLRLFGRGVSPLAAGWAVVALLWVLLFVQNTFRAPLFSSGFDAPAHAEYVQYILDHRALPLAGDGWEMHHPPLYYVVAAGLLRVCGLSTADPDAAVVFRVLGLAGGLATLALVAASLGLLFQGQPRRQLAGLFLAAVLPAHLYTCHYLTNEALLIPLGAAALYLCLRVLGDEHPSVARHALLGLCLGAALLTKITALVVAGSVFLVLAGRLLARREQRPDVWLRGVGVTLLVTVVVSGWHYARVWSHYGTPLVGNFDLASGFWWWQPPGFGTAAYLCGFGHALTEPFYSAVYGLPDGLYSTLWGDGMCGGMGAWTHRPPWNYDLMAAGYLLALLPTAAIVIGLAIALWQLLRHPRAEWFLLLGVLAGLTIALLYQFLRYPYYGHGRASYLLTGLLPACALGALGLDALARLGRAPAALLLVLLGTWGLTAYASFWIDPGAAATYNWAGDQHLRAKSFFQARGVLRDAVKVDPRAVQPRLNLVRALLAISRTAEARGVIDGVLRDAPDDAEALLMEAVVCRGEGRAADGLASIRRASELAPDHPAVFRLLAGALMERHQDAEADAAYRQGLRVTPWDATLHANLGLLLARMARTEEALAQYRLATDLAPDQPEWLADLAWMLATLEDPGLRAPEEAVRLATQACQLTEYRDATGLRSLAAAQAACGRYAEARELAERAAAGQSPLSAASKEQIDAYQAGKPYYARGPLRDRPYDALMADSWPRATPRAPWAPEASARESAR
jgi:tetratricopeptide (TPR) repeat protein